YLTSMNPLFVFSARPSPHVPSPPTVSFCSLHIQHLQRTPNQVDCVLFRSGARRRSTSCPNVAKSSVSSNVYRTGPRSVTAAREAGAANLQSWFCSSNGPFQSISMLLIFRSRRRKYGIFELGILEAFC